MRQALCFGAGNIGRGFIAQVCQESNIKLTFVDVNETILNLISSRHEYVIKLLDEANTSITIRDVDAIHSQDIEALAHKIQDVDFIFTAVGPNVLRHVATTLSNLYERFPHLKHHVIACENMVGGSSALKDHVLNTGITLPEGVDFLDAAVDRIVPLSQESGSLDVKVEPSFEWIVATDSPLNLNGVIEVSDLEPYIKRKLLMVNGAHAFTAYLGLLHGYTMIDQAINDPKIEESVRGLLSEHQLFLNHTFGLDPHDLQKMQDKVIKRFKNSLLQDDCVRVGRTPLRKIGIQERLSMGISTLLSLGHVPSYAYQAIAAATCYFEDEEGLKLKAMDDQGLIQLLETLPLTPESIDQIMKYRQAFLKSKH
jgi:mannitol-1-phosphate 5-dehydrogenase